MTYRLQVVTAGNCGACKRMLNSPTWQEISNTAKKYPQLEFDHLELPSMSTKTPAGYPPTVLRAWFPMIYIVGTADFKEGKMNAADIFSGKFTERGDLENTDQPTSLAPQWIDAQMKLKGIQPYTSVSSQTRMPVYRPTAVPAAASAVDEEKVDTSTGAGAGQSCQLFLSRTFG